MNHLTTLYVNQADRERQVADDLRKRQMLHVEALPQADPRRRERTQPDGRGAGNTGSALSPRAASR